MLISEALILGVISFVGTCIGTFGGVASSNKLTEYRILKLEEKVNKHNGLIERMGIVEARSRIFEKRLDNIENRLYA